jgi:hypothetical protein
MLYALCALKKDLDCLIGTDGDAEFAGNAFISKKGDFHILPIYI